MSGRLSRENAIRLLQQSLQAERNPVIAFIPQIVSNSCDICKKHVGYPFQRLDDIRHYLWHKRTQEPIGMESNLQYPTRWTAMGFHLAFVMFRYVVGHHA